MSAVSRLRRALFGLLCLTPRFVSGQSVVTDSMYDYAGQYWRGKMTVAATSGDSLTITCDPYGATTSGWGALVKFAANVPWSPDAIGSSSFTMFGIGSTSTGSRMDVRWPDGHTDYWAITFSRNSSVNWAGAATTDLNAVTRAASGARAGFLRNGDGFLAQLIKHGRVAVTYPTVEWFRSFELTFTDEQRGALKSMYDRCSKRLEGMPPPAKK